MTLSAKHLVATFGLLTIIMVTPTTALARGSVHLDLPGFSIEVHDDHRSNKRYRHRERSRHHDYYNDGRYYNDRRYKKRGYRQHRKHRDRYYSNRRYNHNYYSSGRQYNRGYNDGRRAEVCPVDGYSRNYKRNRNCYEHKDHYHCS